VLFYIFPNQIGWAIVISLIVYTVKQLNILFFGCDIKLLLVFDCCAETDKDTQEKELSEMTFKPKLCMFEDDIMKAMGIKEDRKWPEYYYY